MSKPEPVILVIIWLLLALIVAIPIAANVVLIAIGQTRELPAFDCLFAILWIATAIRYRKGVR